MKSRTNLMKAFAVTSVAAIALTACGDSDNSAASGDEVTLQYAFFAPASTFPALQMEEWADEIEERTDGQVSVETFPGATLLDSGDIYPGVVSDIVEVGLDGASYDPIQFPLSSAVTLPLGLANAEQASGAFLELLLEEEPDEFDGFHIVTAFTSEPAYIQTAEPVRTLEDLQGLTLRSPGGAHNNTLEALGVVPVGMPPPEIAENLGTGTLDGIVGSREQLMDFEFAEFLPYLTEVPLGPSAAFVAVMDEEKYNSLSDDVQEEILELREEMSVFAGQYHDSQVLEAIDWSQENYDLEVIELDDAEIAEWQKHLDETVDHWVADNEDADFDPQAVVERLRESTS